MLTTSVATPAQTKSLTRAQRDVFAFLDTIDDTDTSSMQFVRVSRLQTENTQASFRLGFLVAQDDETTRVRYWDGRCETLRTHAIGGKQQIRIDPLSLPDEMQRMNRHVTGPNRHPGLLECRLLLLARSAARIGHDTSVHQAWEALPATFLSVGELRNQDLHDSIAAVTHRCLTDAFADPQKSLADIERAHERWLEAFSAPQAAKNLQGKRARPPIATADRLRPRVQQRLDSIQKTRASIANHEQQATTENQRLAFQLRYATSHNTDIQDRIVARGLEIVPDLIACLNCEDLTRHCNVDTTPTKVLTVGTFAHTLLARIAGYSPAKSEMAETWRVWHASVAAKGLRAVLEAEMKNGNHLVIVPYLKKWPEQLPRVLTFIGPEPEKNITGVLAMLQGLPQTLPRQAMLACERALASSTLFVFKELIGERLRSRTTTDGTNALQAMLDNDSIDESTRNRLKALLSKPDLPGRR